MINKKQFIAEFTEEAEEQLLALSIDNRKKIVEAIRIFENVDTLYKNINDLGNGLYEIKPKGVRAYFMYDSKRKKIIIIGLIVLKKTQKAPSRYIKQAYKNIEQYINQQEKNI